MVMNRTEKIEKDGIKGLTGLIVMPFPKLERLRGSAGFGVASKF